MITYRHRHFDDETTREEPLFNRLLVKYEDRDAGLVDEKTGILLGGYGVSDVFERDGFGKVSRNMGPNNLAQIIETGFAVDPEDFRVGDWVLCAPNCGTMIGMTDGSELGMIETSDVPINLGQEKPADRVEWKNFRESICA